MSKWVVVSDLALFCLDDLILLLIYVIGGLSPLVTINITITLVRGKITMYHVQVRCV